MLKNTKARFAGIRLDSAKIGEDGIFRAKGRIARIGTQTYGDSIEYRSPKQVSDSAPGFDQLPITRRSHDGGFVTVTNKDELVVGFISNPVYNDSDGWIHANIVIHRQDAINEITSTDRWFSAGYDAGLLEEPGTYVDSLGVQGAKGAEYSFTGVQVGITPNHVTITDSPRSGKSATYTDSLPNSVKQVLDADLKTNDNINISNVDINKETKTTMAYLIHDGVNLEIEGKDADKVISAFQTIKNDAITSTETVANLEATALSNNEAQSALNAKLDAVTAENETLKANAVTKEDSDKQDLNTLVATELTNRSDAWAVAQPILKLDSVDYTWETSKIQTEALKVAYPTLAEKLDSAESTYISTLWEVLKDGVVAPVAKNDSTENEVKTIVEASVTETKQDSISDAAAAYLAKRCK